jgi:hypothetical protein
MVGFDLAHVEMALASPSPLAVGSLVVTRPRPDRWAWHTPDRTVAYTDAAHTATFARELLAQALRLLANEARHRADHTEDDGQRAVALAEAAELDAKVDGLAGDWPVAGAR